MAFFYACIQKHKVQTYFSSSSEGLDFQSSLPTRLEDKTHNSAPGHQAVIKPRISTVQNISWWLLDWKSLGPFASYE